MQQFLKIMKERIMILNANSVMKISPIVPVVVVDNANEALDLAKNYYTKVV